MGMWPFRRKTNRRKSASATPATGGAVNAQSAMHDAGALRDPGRHNAPELTSTSAGPERRKSRRDTKRKSSRESKKLQRDPERRRTYSFSPGRKDSIRVPRTLDRPPVPPLPTNVQGNARSNTINPDPVIIGNRPLRARTEPPEDTQTWQRMPTLHKRSAQELAHRKSSKKRKEEHKREAEIKAMVAFMPNRPAADSNSSGRPMRRESKKMRGGLNRHMDNPSSDISLPLADSLRSSVSGNSDHQPSYILNAFDMLAPRPTIRYAENPRYMPGASGFGGSDGSGSRKKRVSDRISIPKEALKANKRIDDLADDLDAGELRELMERDQKRRDKKQIAERIKMERRLARRQEKQTADEAAAAREGTSLPANMERGVLGREIVGLGIGTSAVVTSSKRKGSVGSENGRGKRPADAFRQDSGTSIQPPTFHRSASLLTENLTPTSEFQDPVIETAIMGTVGRANISPTSSPRIGGHTRGASSISQMLDLSRPEPAASQPIPIPEPATARRDSQRTPTPPPKQPQSWTSFFRLRGGKKQQQESAPSSFSNTSRDSMHSGQGPTIGYTPMRSTSNIPKRTMSKFREDLPELPISPPDSRVQSPEADTIPPIPDRKLEDHRTRYDTPTSGYRSIDAMRLRDETPTSGHRTFEDPSPEPANVLSQSLASIGSEGSWLSGKVAGKRGSAPTPQPFPDESAEELGIAEDEYFSRLSPGPEEENKIHRLSTGNPMPSSDDEEGSNFSPVSTQSKWGAVGRQPTVIYRQPRVKSREGLLNDFDEDSTSEGPDSPDSPNPNSGLQRATSVDYKKQARHMSAGSARLLDLKPRPSADTQRDSLAEEV